MQSNQDISMQPKNLGSGGFGSHDGNPLEVSRRQPVDTVTIERERDKVRDAKIMIVDDEQLVIRVVRRFLTSDGYSNFVTITDSRQAIEAIEKEKPDVVLLDIMMPHVTGLELLKVRERTNLFKHIPFIILSANSENQTKREALKLGATEFLSKPVDPFDLVLRVQNALIVKKHHDHLENYAAELSRQVRLRTKQIEASREQVIHCLARAAEYRDNETGEHVIRVGKYCGVIADALGFEPDYCRQIELAAQLHDVGKIGIPDNVLLNPGSFTDEQRAIMQTHCDLGCEIINPLAISESIRVQKQQSSNSGHVGFDDSPMLQMASTIARTHHERWDGKGYPNRLKGEQIPIEGRIVAVADVYDALCSKRPYKPAFSIRQSLEKLIEGRGSQFDPAILDAFLSRIADVERIRNDYADGQMSDNR